MQHRRSFTIAASQLRTVIADIQSDLHSIANAPTKAWWENYVKGASFRGVKMQGVRDCVNRAHSKHGLGTAMLQDRVDIALALIAQQHTEDKMAGILLLHERIIKDHDTSADLEVVALLDHFPRLYTDGHLADWNICDWFSTKVLSGLYTRSGCSAGEFVDRTLAWVTADNLWQRRAAVVGFVNHAKLGDAGNFPGFVDRLLRACLQLAESKERFAQTGAGWVLRELSVVDPVAVTAALQTNADSFTSEGMRYASEKLTAAAKKKLKVLHLNSVDASYADPAWLSSKKRVRGSSKASKLVS
jgi:3-methyladenine DNA glycosylase AlkD